jgi:hypothetical protein
MSVKLDREAARTGTRFRLFPQPRFLSAFRNPETVHINLPPGSITAGPADDRMFVVDALNKDPYDRLSGPPFFGLQNPAVQPGADGHFDHLDLDSREFSCATMYATVRRTLDIWEDYFGHSIPWHFDARFERLEMIPLIDWDNAQSGFGFLEFGFGRSASGGIDPTRPYCQNFDVLAHELGHSIIFSQVGVPSSPNDEAIDYGGMHESAGDLVAIVASLHFNSVVDHLLEHTRGNLFSANELARVGELSESREIRTAFNSLRMSDVGDEPHDRSEPLTGGFFDVMVEIFQKRLVARGLISQSLATRSTQGPGGSPDTAGIQAEFDALYAGHEDDFKEELLKARDELGVLLARTWQGLNPNFLTYHDIVRRLLQVDRLGETGGRHQQTIRECFAWRGLTVLPRGSRLAQIHSLVSCGLSEDYDRHAELLVAKNAAATAYAGRSLEAVAAVIAPVKAVPRTNSRKRAARRP